MRRAVPILTATVFGVVLLASFRTSPAPTAVTTTPAGGRVTSPVPTTIPPAGGPPGRSGSGSSSSTSLPSTGARNRVIDGPPEENRYGTVQVRVTLSGARIVDVEALQLPSDRSRSAQISDFAGPRLRQEALAAQSAQVHTVSGATYTSGGYRQSLQAALDQAAHS